MGGEGRSWLDLRAVTAGAIFGGGVMAVLAIVMALVMWQVPLGPRWLSLGALAVQLLAGLLAGHRAGSRARDRGLWHGVLAGVGLAALVMAVQAIAWSAPPWANVLQRAGMMAAAGGLGGVFGVRPG